MKSRLLFVVAMIFSTVLSGVGLAVRNTAIRNPIGVGTIPPSSISSGLVRSPNPIDRSQNLVVTGNVGGGKHFRGVVPYNAISDFGGRLGSGSLDSFLRRSAGSGEFSHYTGKPVPFYSQTGTVTTTRPNRPHVFKPPGVKMEDRAVEGFALPAIRGERVLLESDTAASKIRFRPMSMTTRELERFLSSEVEKYSREEAERDKRRFVRPGEPTIEQDQEPGLEQFQQDLKRVSDKVVELRQKLIVEGDSLRPSTESSADIVQPFKMERPTKEIGKDKELDVYEQMMQQIGGLQEGLEWDSERATKDAFEVGAEIDKVEISAKAKAILGSYKTFASFSEDRFNQHMRIAEGYLKRGKYYRAADVYTLASVYKPEDPLAYAGKSHALFAAGEYMSSALFLSRALEIFPEYARFKIDIEAMMGDRDKLEDRVVDIEQWQKKNNSAELQFLLGYVYYQMDRLEQAKESIDGAYEKMPEVPAVITLKKAIDENL